jgi:hypothetical protein
MICVGTYFIVLYVEIESSESNFLLEDTCVCMADVQHFYLF